MKLQYCSFTQLFGTAVEIIAHEAPVLLFHAIVRNHHLNHASVAASHGKQTIIIQQTTEVIVIRHVFGRERRFQVHYNRPGSRNLFYYAHPVLALVALVDVR